MRNERPGNHLDTFVHSSYVSMRYILWPPACSLLGLNVVFLLQVCNQCFPSITILGVSWLFVLLSSSNCTPRCTQRNTALPTIFASVLVLAADRIRFLFVERQREAVRAKENCNYINGLLAYASCFSPSLLLSLCPGCVVSILCRPSLHLKI